MFDKAKEREGAYDFLESREVSAKAVAEGVFATTAERATKWPYVYVVIDGSSLSTAGRNGPEGFGPVGSRRIPVSGVMVTSSLAVAGDGTPLGLIDQIFWSREKTLPLSKSEVWKRNQERPFEDKEQVHFVHAAEHAIERLRGVGVAALGSSSTAKRTTATSCSPCRARGCALPCAPLRPPLRHPGGRLSS